VHFASKPVRIVDNCAQLLDDCARAHGSWPPPRETRRDFSSPQEAERREREAMVSRIKPFSSTWLQPWACLSIGQIYTFTRVFSRAPIPEELTRVSAPEHAFGVSLNYGLLPSPLNRLSPVNLFL
jgi:hypothetical protein